MKIILLALFAVASTVPVPDNNDKLDLSDETTDDTPLSPVAYKSEPVEDKSMKIPELADVDHVYVSLSEPKRYVEMTKPVIKEPVYKHPVYKEIVFNTPIYKVPFIESEEKEDEDFTPRK